MDPVEVDIVGLPADQGAGDSIPSPKVSKLEHQEAISPETPSHDAQQSEAQPAPALVPFDSGFVEPQPTGPIFLHQCGQCPTLPSFQSDCLKVSTWLRAIDAHYLTFHHKLALDGRFPTVEMADREIVNSTQMLTELSGLLKRSLDIDLTVEQNILAYSLASLTEHTLAREHREWYRTKRGELLRAYGIDLKKSWKKSLPNPILEFVFKKCSSKRSPIPPTTVAETTAVLMTLSKLLASKNYFFGQDTVSTLDVEVFAVLVPILAIPEEIRYETRNAIRENYPNLVDFVDRMKMRFFPDWEDQCCGSDGKEVVYHEKNIEQSQPAMANEDLNSGMDASSKGVPVRKVLETHV